MLGQVIDRYTLVEKLGAGGMGQVFKGHQAALDQYRAVKLLPPHLSQNPELVERFLREAKRGAALNHPNIVRLEHVGQQDGFHYLVMDYVPGRSLRQLIDEHGPLKPERAVALLQQICRALAYAHDAGVVHRDVKPSNILIEDTGRAVLTDFGIARWGEGDEPALTAAGTTVGTPEYMSPEQIRGEPVDMRSDLYSLGVVLYETLTGELPFRARSRTNVRRQQLDKAPDPPRYYQPSIPVALETVVLKALAKDPAKRFASASELEQALRVAVSVPATPTVQVSQGVASEPLMVAGTPSIGWLGGTNSKIPAREPEHSGVAIAADAHHVADNPDPTPVDNPIYVGPAYAEPAYAEAVYAEPVEKAQEAVDAQPTVPSARRVEIPPKPQAATGWRWPEGWPEPWKQWPEGWPEPWKQWPEGWPKLPASFQEQKVAFAAGAGLLVLVVVTVLSLDQLVSAGAGDRFTAEKGVDPKSGKEYGIVRAHGVPIIVLTQPSGNLKPAQRAVSTAERLERFLDGSRGGPLQPEQIEAVHDARGELVLARRAKGAGTELPDPEDVLVTVDTPTAATYAGTNRTSLALWWRDVLRDQLRLARGRPPVFTYNTKYADTLDHILQKVEPRKPGNWIPPGTIRSVVNALPAKERKEIDEAWHTVPAAWRAGGTAPKSMSRSSASGPREPVGGESVSASDSVPGLTARAIIDGDPQTSWQSRQGFRFAGQRHWLKITVPPGAAVSQLEVQEGRHSIPRLQFRAKQIKAKFSDGSVERIWRRKPTDPLRITFPPRRANWVRLEVEKVFANPRPGAARLCVAEVRLWGPKAEQTLSAQR